MPAPLSPGRHEEVAAGSAVDRAGNDYAVLFQGHKRSPEWDAANKASCTIDRINDPAPGAGLTLPPELLAENRVVREAPPDPLTRHRFGFPVGSSDFGTITLELDVQSCPEMPESCIATQSRHFFDST
jgi:hypothetical protein